MIGVGAMFGDAFPFGDVIARTSGAVHVLGVDIFRREMDRRGAFHAIITQYCQSFMALAAQSAACNGLHSAHQRCCRWLLASSYRLQNDEMPVTHEMLAMMLGVRRPTVTLTLQQLATAGLIWQNRGKVRIVNRAGLENAACECHTHDKQLAG
jgi:CRP-like cAMP-binding protein